MHLPLATIALVSCLVLGTRSEDNDTRLANEALHAVVKGSNEFGTALYQVLSSTPGNLAMSPLSIHTVMSTVWLGATGNTSDQLATGLNLPENRSHVESGFRALLTSVKSSPIITLDMANKLYIQEGYQLKAPFRQSVVNSFRSDAEEVNFVNETEAARMKINQWVEQKTHDKIKQLIAPGTLSEYTRMLAVNAIYFRGGWLKPFNENLTTVEPFHETFNSSINVSMMHLTDYFYHGSFPDLGFRAVKLLYRGPDDRYADRNVHKSMLILLPDSVDGLESLEANLTSVNVSFISDQLWKDELILSFPKFSIESTLKLVDSLGELGITNIFRPGAELSGITDDDVYLKDVIQKAFIEVGEKGTEAAAATYYELVNFSGSSPYELRLDHPFLFFIIDEVTDAILFMGRVVSPNSRQ